MIGVECWIGENFQTRISRNSRGPPAFPTKELRSPNARLSAAKREVAEAKRVASLVTCVTMCLIWVVLKDDHQHVSQT